MFVKRSAGHCETGLKECESFDKSLKGQRATEEQEHKKVLTAQTINILQQPA